jgi:hypothetical protein
MDLVKLDQDRAQWQACVNMIRNLQVRKRWNFLIDLAAAVNFSN